jgi:hypothetical protein
MIKMNTYSYVLLQSLTGSVQRVLNSPPSEGWREAPGTERPENALRFQ